MTDFAVADKFFFLCDLMYRVLSDEILIRSYRNVFSELLFYNISMISELK